MLTDADRLVAAYSRALLFALGQPLIVWVSRNGTPKKIPALAGLPMRVLMTGHVKRGLRVLRHGLTWQKAAGGRGARRATETLAAIESVEASLPTFGASRRLIFAAIVALLLLLQLISTLETQTTFLSELVLSVFGLDPDRAATAIRNAGTGGVLGSVGLVMLVAAVYLLIPAWAMVSKRRVFELDENELTSGDLDDPMPTPSERYGGTYKLERAAFDAVGVSGPPERQPDLALAGVLWLPMLISIAILCVAGWATSVVAGLFVSILLWGGLGVATAIIAAALDRQGRLPARRPQRLRQGINLSIIGMAALIGLVVRPDAGGDPKPQRRAEVTSVTVAERAATIRSVAEQSEVSLEELPNRDAFGLFGLAPGVRTDAGDELLGMVVSFDVASHAENCRCGVRWTIYDAATMTPFGEGELRSWWGRGWPKATIHLRYRRTTSGITWIPLPDRAGRFFVKLEIVDGDVRSNDHVVAAADTAVAEVPERDGALDGRGTAPLPVREGP